MSGPGACLRFPVPKNHITRRALAVLAGQPTEGITPGDTACGILAEPVRTDFSDSLLPGDKILTVQEVMQFKKLRKVPPALTCGYCIVAWDAALS